MEVIIEQEIALHQFEVRQDKLEIARLIHPDFKEVGKSGNSYDFKSIVQKKTKRTHTKSMKLV